jgi:hypothetical protein
MRAWCLVALGACSAGMRSQNRIVAQDIFTVDVSTPARDLHWRGYDSEVGGYSVGNCTLSYDAGMYQGGLMPDDDVQKDWAYRVTRVDGRLVRQARYTQVIADRTGPYWLAMYVSGLEVAVACPTSTERDAAVSWLETLRFGTHHLGDLRGDNSITGPTAWSPPPAFCDQTTEPSGGGTSDATLVIRTPSDAPIWAVIASSPAETQSLVARTENVPFTASLPAGTYNLDVTSDTVNWVRCRGIAMRPGQATTVRIRRFSL